MQKQQKKKTSLFIAAALMAVSAFVALTQCQKNFDGESFSPSLPPYVKSISANGGGALYCSISGGCPLKITGARFTKTSIPYIGPYACRNVVYNADMSEINCNVGPAQNGVYKISVRNSGIQSAEIDPSIPASGLDFSYASFLYVGSQENPGKVYGYAQNPETGALITIPGSPFSVATSAVSTYGVVIHPNNKFLYAANVSSGTVSAYSIDPLTGKLTSIDSPILSRPTGGGSPNGLFFHPSGNYLYVSNQAGSITGFDVATDGKLTRMASSPFTTAPATGINGLVVSADGKFLYAAAMGDFTNNTGVVGYTIDSTGALTMIPGSPFLNTLGGDTANPGDGITIHPNSKWLYMGVVAKRKIAGWNIDQATGALTAIEAPVLNNSTTGYVDNGGSASTVSPDGKFLYGTAFSTTSTDPKKIVVYAIDQTTGGLSRVSDIDTGGGPNDVRVDTTGNFAYTCNSLNPPSISAYAINKDTGSLSALSPRDYGIAAPNSGPGIMVMQRNSQAGLSDPQQP